jgi:hypothetical protein
MKKERDGKRKNKTNYRGIKREREGGGVRWGRDRNIRL